MKNAKLVPFAFVLGSVFLWATANGRAQLSSDAEPAVEDAAVQEVEETEDDVEVEAQRAWLREQLSAGLTSERRLAAMHARVDEMTAEQLDRAVAVLKNKQQRQAKEFRRALQRQQRAAAAREQLRWMVAADFAAHRGFGGVGYAPVVTWLPSGVGFHSGGVITDGRYVRLYGGPWFTRIGAFDSYPFVTKVYRSSRQCNDRGPRKPVVWHDGLRTRYGYPPEPAKRIYGSSQR